MLNLCAVNEVMPGRRSVFKNWADYCSVEMEKLVIWNSRSLKLLQEIEPLLAFQVILLMCADQERFVSRWIPRNLDQEEPDMHESGRKILPTQPHIGPGDFRVTCSVAL